MNDNRIVRVRNDRVHKIILHVAKLTKKNYQYVFEVFLDYVEQGHVVGEYTHLKIIEIVLKENQ